MASGTVKFLGVPVIAEDQQPKEKVEDEEDIIINDDISQSNDNYKPDTKSRNFEFTDNLGIMRFVRVLTFLQFIAIILDNPSVKTPALFDLFCTHGFIYILQFYCRPFADICRIMQYFGQIIISTASNLQAESHGRRLTTRYVCYSCITVYNTDVLNNKSQRRVYYTIILIPLQL